MEPENIMDKQVSCFYWQYSISPEQRNVQILRTCLGGASCIRVRFFLKGLANHLLDSPGESLQVVVVGRMLADSDWSVSGKNCGIKCLV